MVRNVEPATHFPRPSCTEENNDPVRVSLTAISGVTVGGSSSAADGPVTNMVTFQYKAIDGTKAQITVPADDTVGKLKAKIVEQLQYSHTIRLKSGSVILTDGTVCGELDPSKTLNVYAKIQWSPQKQAARLFNNGKIKNPTKYAPAALRALAAVSQHYWCSINVHMFIFPCTIIYPS